LNPVMTTSVSATPRL